MDNPEVSLRFGLLLEAYCRGCITHMDSLQKQVKCIYTKVTIRMCSQKFLNEAILKISKILAASKIEVSRCQVISLDGQSF